VSAVNFSDVINASAAGANGSVIHGYGGNDALSGSAGKDDIFGDEGDDLIGGGAGSDNIRGGDGNDFISSSATLNVQARLRPDDSWSAPAGKEVLTQGARWGIYKDTTADGKPVTRWSGVNLPQGSDGDVVDGGAGTDCASNKVLVFAPKSIATCARSMRARGRFFMRHLVAGESLCTHSSGTACLEQIWAYRQL
jgi:Ca2+-binding RTX toxin-like protein